MCGTVWVSECATNVFVVFVWDSLGSKCAAGGFMVSVFATVGGVSMQQVALW